MIKKIILTIIAALMLFLTIVSAVHASHVSPSMYPGIYSDYAPVSPNYLYYEDRHDNRIPTVSGPYPRYELRYDATLNSGLILNGQRTGYMHDDLNHFDEFIGYRDLDVFYPGRGYVDVLRNPSASLDEIPLPDNLRVARSPSQSNVYGMLPGDAIYRKHYYHEHPWQIEGEGYEYGYGNFIPNVAYRSKPIMTNSCGGTTICQATHCCA